MGYEATSQLTLSPSAIERICSGRLVSHHVSVTGIGGAEGEAQVPIPRIRTAFLGHERRSGGTRCTIHEGAMHGERNRSIESRSGMPDSLVVHITAELLPNW
jgi:hypothetical protein